MNDGLKDISILVVEDDEDTRELLKVLLETQGALVTTTATVQEALNAYDQLQAKYHRCRYRHARL